MTEAATDTTPVRGQIEPGGRNSLDSLIDAAAADVDRSLLRWTLSLSPRERLRACTEASRSLDRLRGASA